MGLFHQHRWERISATYVQSSVLPTKVSRADEDWLDRVLFGFTVVVLRCRECGDEKAHEFRGDATNARSPRAETAANAREER